jgi:hypothetical protein
MRVRSEQEPMKVLSLQLRDLKVQDKRQGMLIHQVLLQFFLVQ